MSVLPLYYGRIVLIIAFTCIVTNMASTLTSCIGFQPHNLPDSSYGIYYIMTHGIRERILAWVSDKKYLLTED